MVADGEWKIKNITLKKIEALSVEALKTGMRSVSREAVKTDASKSSKFSLSLLKKKETKNKINFFVQNGWQGISFLL